MNTHFLKYLLTLFVLFFSLETQAYIPNRLAFPPICEKHFENNIATARSWMESEDKQTLDAFRPYFYLIPKVYYSTCFTCRDCWGLWVDMGACAPITLAGDLDVFWDGHQFISSARVHRCRYKGDVCTDASWDGGYFRLWNRKYLPFFKQYLHYCFENKECYCYWPEYNKRAVKVNNDIHYLVKNLAKQNLIDETFSEHWKGEFAYWGPSQGLRYGGEYYPDAHGMASSLTTYTFFYSHYRELLDTLLKNIVAKNSLIARTGIRWIYYQLEDLKKDFAILYSLCLDKHPHPKIFYERGMLHLYCGNATEAVADIRSMVALCQTEAFKDSDIFTSHMHKEIGSAFVEVCDYDRAIAELTKAIEKDPKNSEAYFQRAIAFFEKGKFRESLEDYLKSEIKEIARTNLPKQKPSVDFAKGLIAGIKSGIKAESVSVCQFFYGMGQGLWAFGEHPIDTSIELADQCQMMATNFVNYCKSVDREYIESCTEECQKLIEDFDNLGEHEQGELIGRIIGTFGVDIFSGMAAMEAVSACKTLKELNYLATLRQLAQGTSKERIEAIAIEQAAKRRSYFEQVTLNVDKQNKHVPGSHNFEVGKSEFFHKDPKVLLEKYAGTGHKVSGNPGQADYREMVDFGEVIGVWKNKMNTESLTTTRGTIHYDGKNSAHIVPAHPNGK